MLYGLANEFESVQLVDRNLTASAMTNVAALTPPKPVPAGTSAFQLPLM